MFKDVNIPITKEIYMTCEPIVLVSRIWGLFPLAVHRDGNKIAFKQSILLNIYSYIVAVVLAVMIVRGLIYDFEAGEKSVRMKTSLSVYVTIADVTIIACTVFIGITGAPLHVKCFKNYVRNIVEVDKIICLNDREKARKISIVVLGVVLLFLLTLLMVDFSTWIRFANHSEDAEYRVTNYLPFYMGYVIVIIMECQFWFVITSLLRRLRVLTDLLSKDNFQKGFCTDSNKLPPTFRSNSEEDVTNMSPKYFNEIIDKFGKKSPLKIISSNYNNGTFTFDFKRAEHIDKLIKVYYKISVAVKCINNFCGVFLLVILMSCLTHLVITPYFLVMEIYSRRDVMYITLQCFWIFGHSCRIIGIVEPCHRFKQEEKKVISVVSKLLYVEDGGERMKPQLRRFFDLITTTDNEFTACGLARIDRGIITTIMGTVTTYLVILIQFQKSSYQL